MAHDLLWAARCLRFREDLHLLRVPPERLRSRRIEPLELGAASGDPLLSSQIAERYAVPVPTLLAGMADAALLREVRTVTRCLDGPPEDALDLAGLAALCWSAALAATIRGFDDEAALAAALVRRACADAPGLADEARGAGAGPLFRYEACLDGLDRVRAGDGAAVARCAGLLAASSLAALRAAMSGEDWARPPQAPRYVDLAAVALAALHRSRGGACEEADLPDGASLFAPLLAPPAAAGVPPRSDPG